MATENKRFAKALSMVLQDFGTETLQNVDRLNALLMDYSPQDAKDRRLICTVLRQGVGDQLLAVREASSEEQKTCISKCMFQLKNDTWLSEDASAYALNILCTVLGIESFERAEKQETRHNQTSNITLIKGVIPDKEARIERFLPTYNAIGYKALATNSAITDVVIPDSIKAVFSKAFCDCVNLKSIGLPDNLENIAPGAFKGCVALEKISIGANKRYTIVNGMLIDKIEKALIRAVNIRGQKTIRIPDQITSIYAYAFDQSPAETIVLPSNLVSLSERAFWQCSALSRIEINPKCRSYYTTSDGVLHDFTRTVLVKYPSGSQVKNYYLEDDVKKIGAAAFLGATNLESITFTNALEEIGYRAFDGCKKLTSLVIPSSVKVIGERALQNCTGLTHVMLPRGITEIGDYAFNGCESVQQINVPQSVVRIGHGAFCGCKTLKKVIIQDKVSFIGDGVFTDCPEEVEIFVRNNPYVETYCKKREIAFH